MSTIDKQRIEAVRTLERFGYRFAGMEWVAPAETSTEAWPLVAEADAMHALLGNRADALEGCGENSPEQTELFAITETMEAYEAKRWPNGKAVGGKG